MNQNFWDSIILITSNDSDFSGNFGTGFVIHQDEQKTYVLTCAHVVNKVGGSDKVKVAGHSATVEAMGDRESCDLAVLTVEDKLTKLLPLKLGKVVPEGREFVAAGFYTDNTKTHKLAGISGQFGGMQILESREGDRTRAWNLKISDDSEHELKAGYSGSPVVDKTTGCVLGVIAQQEGQGKGVAISIEALGKIWEEIPDNLINNRNQEKMDTEVSQNPARLQRQLKDIQNEIEEKESQRDSKDGEIKSIKNRLKTILSPGDEYKLNLQVKQLENERTKLEEELYELDDKKYAIERNLKKR